MATTFQLEELKNYIIEIATENQMSSPDDVWEYVFNVFKLKQINDTEKVKNDADEKWAEMENYHWQIPLWAVSDITNHEKMQYIGIVSNFCQNLLEPLPNVANTLSEEEKNRLNKVLEEFV